MNAPTMPDAASSACRTALEELRGFRAKIDAAILGLECLIGSEPAPRPVRVATPREPKDEEQGRPRGPYKATAHPVILALQEGPKTAQQVSEWTKKHGNGLSVIQASGCLNWQSQKGLCKCDRSTNIWSLA